MKIKNIFLLLFLAVLSNNGVVIAMDKPDILQQVLELRNVSSSLANKNLLLLVASNKNIESALSAGANPNIFDDSGVKILDQNMIQAGIQTTIGFTPLLYACMFCNIDNAKLLLEHGADVNLKSKRSNIPPIYAAFFSLNVNKKKQYELAQFLIDHGADVNVYGPGHHSFLQRAVAGGDEQFIKKLLKETKVEINSVDINGNNALADAVMAGANLNIIRALFDAGCLPVNDYAGASLFHKAVEKIDTLMNGGVSILELLYEKGLDVNAKDIHDETPLHWASEMASYNVVKKLLDLGADPRIKNDKGRTALQLSAHNPSTTVNILLKKAKQPVVVQKIAKKEEKPKVIKKEEKPALKKEEEKKAEKVVTQELPKQELPKGEKASGKKKNKPRKRKKKTPAESVDSENVPPAGAQPPVETQPPVGARPLAEIQRTEGGPQETPVIKPVAEKAPAQGTAAASDKPKKEKPSLKEKISAAKQTVVGVLNPERREASILQAGRTYAVAAGAPATRVPQPEENLIDFPDDLVDVVAYKWKSMSQTNPLIGLLYSKHVQDKMNSTTDVFHNFSTRVEEQLGSFMDAKITQEATEKHSAEIKYTIPATMTTLHNKFVGRFEFVVKDGEIRHRFFKPDKRANEKYFEQKEQAPLLLPAAPTKYQKKDVDVKR